MPCPLSSVRALALVAAGAALVACNDQSVGVYNTPPVVSIVRPLDGSAFDPNEVIEIEAVADDSQDAPEELSLYWTSSLDGQLGEGAPDSNGEIYLALTELTAGVQAITLTVVDTNGESASETVSLNVGYGSGEGAPTVIFVGPAEGSEISGGDGLTVVGTVTDEQQPWDTLDITLTSSIDGNLWLGNPASTGTVTADLDPLTIGPHILTLIAEDEDGNIGQASVNITVLEDGRPEVSIDSPTSGETFSITDTISFQGTVVDDETEANLLRVTWESDIDGVLTTGNPDSSGFTAVGRRLSEGTHTVTLTAIDDEDKIGNASVVVVVADPLNTDDDGDGMTENEGDCDDRDATVYLGAPELCDALDNDCDGEINEDMWDSYESNDTKESPFDLGEVDGEILWAGASASLGGVTLHSPDDVDAFGWDANDTLIFDNVSIQVRATGLPSSGNYTIQLWLNDGGWEMKDSDSGSGALTVSYSGDLLDDDEDDWVLIFYANTWPTDSCDTAYEIEIDS